MARALAIALSLSRMAFGITCIAAPKLVQLYWAGPRSRDRTDTKLFARGFGARDVALGLGSFVTLVRGDPNARLWLAAQAVSEGADLASTIAAKDKLPDKNAKLVTGLTGVSAAVALGSAAALGGRHATDA